MVYHEWPAALDVIWHIYSHLYCSLKVGGRDLPSSGEAADLLKTHRGPAPWWELPPRKMASPYHHPSRSSTGVSKCVKSHLEPKAMDDASSWARQGCKDPCLNSSPEKLSPGQSAQNSQGTFPMVGAASPEDGKSLPPFFKEQHRCK